MDSIDKANFFRKIRLFNNLDEIELNEIANLSVIKFINKNEYVLNENEYGDAIYFIYDGFVEIYKKDRLITRLGKYDFFGEMSLIDRKARSANVKAVSKLTLLKIGRVEFQAMLTTFPQVVYETLVKINRRLRDMLTEVEHDYTNLQSAHKQLKETQEQLIHSEKLSTIGRITSNIVHEIKNQLMVDGFLKILKKQKQDDMLIQETCEIVMDAHNRIIDLIQEIRNYAKKTSTEYILDKMFIHEVIDNTISLMQHDPSFLEREIIKSYSSNCFVMIEKNRIQQVTINLLRNAIDATKPRQRVWIRVYDEKDKVVVEIEDEGSGIPEDEIDKIFEPFYTTKGENGTGLGLDICKRIIDGHKATISFESVIGEGTTCRMKFDTAN